jgi:hypothetical protein
VISAVDSLQQARATRRAYKAEDADFKKWLGLQGKDVSTFYRGARGEEGVRTLKVLRAVNLGGGYLNAALTGIAPNPWTAASAAFSLSVASGMRGEIISAERTARERTIGAGKYKPTAERLQRWIDAGIVRPDFAM